MAQDTSVSRGREKENKRRRTKDPEGRMALGEHLVELRNRLIWCAGTLVVTTVIGWFIFDAVFDLLKRPFVQAQEQGLHAELNFNTVGSGLSVTLQMAAYIGIILAMPMFLYQVWMFIVPGLHKNERKYAVGFFGSAIPLFALGCVMGYIAINRAVPLLMTFTPGGEQVTQIINYQEYLKLLVTTMLAFGIAFILPVVLVLLNFMDILSARAMLKAWRWVVFVAFAFTAIMVPTPDPVTLIAMAAPIIVLFFGAVGISALNDRRRAKREGDLDDGTASVVDGPSDLDDEDDDR